MKAATTIKVSLYINYGVVIVPKISTLKWQIKTIDLIMTMSVRRTNLKVLRRRWSTI